MQIGRLGPPSASKLMRAPGLQRRAVPALQLRPSQVPHARLFDARILRTRVSSTSAWNPATVPSVPFIDSFAVDSASTMFACLTCSVENRTLSIGPHYLVRTAHLAIAPRKCDFRVRTTEYVLQSNARLELRPAPHAGPCVFGPIGGCHDPSDVGDALIAGSEQFEAWRPGTPPSSTRHHGGRQAEASARERRPGRWTASGSVACPRRRFRSAAPRPWYATTRWTIGASAFGKKCATTLKVGEQVLEVARRSAVRPFAGRGDAHGAGAGPHPALPGTRRASRPIAPLLDAARGTALDLPEGHLLADYMILLERNIPHLPAGDGPKLAAGDPGDGGRLPRAVRRPAGGSQRPYRSHDDGEGTAGGCEKPALAVAQPGEAVPGSSHVALAALPPARARGRRGALHPAPAALGELLVAVRFLDQPFDRQGRRVALLRRWVELQPGVSARVRHEPERCTGRCCRRIAADGAAEEGRRDLVCTASASACADFEGRGGVSRRLPLTWPGMTPLLGRRE